MELVSNHLCPYTQRAATLLHERGVPFRHHYIDLANKPDWLLDISPLGKVPLLRIEGAVLFESAAICEFLDETLPGPSLLPTGPIDRARHRAWIEVASTMIADVFGFYTAPDEAGFRQKATHLRDKCGRLDAALGDGPYFAGDRFGLIDAAFAPIFRLFDGFDAIGPFGLADGLPRLAAYRRALTTRPSVIAAVVPDYGRRFHDYLAGRGSHLSRLMAA